MQCLFLPIRKAHPPLRWSSQRKVFGKPLNSQAVVRAKLAAMISRVESAQHWLESITYQMTHMSYKEQADYLAGYVSLSYIDTLVTYLTIWSVPLRS